MDNFADFDATDKSFRELIKTDTPYRIPRFQRSYSWEQDHVADFWADLTNDAAKNFIGSFVLNYEHERTANRIDIIDGQQRFLTTTIFAAAIRDFFLDELNQEEAARRVHRHNIVLELEDDDTVYPRIEVGDSAKPFFAKHIQDFRGRTDNARAQSKEERRILANYRYFRNQLREFTKDDTPDLAVTKVKKLLSKLKDSYVIHIKIASEEDAFEIFETVNARGVELSVADLLKNLIFKRITESDGSSLEDVHDEWNEILSDLEETGFDLPRFIRYYWLSSHAFVSAKGLFKSIKREITNHRALLDDLKDNATILARISQPTEADLALDFGTYSGRLTRSLKGLSLMRVTQCYVFLLALFRHAEHVSAKRIVGVVNQVESFSFLYSLITKGPGNRVEHMYSRAALELNKAAKRTKKEDRDKAINDALNKLQNAMRDLKPERDQFLKDFKSLKYGSTNLARKRVGYVLAKIDAHFEGTGERVPDFEMVNIEHILPQKPSTAWAVPKRDHRECVNLVGNLTLVSKKINSAIGNGPLHEKLKKLAESQMPITKDVVGRINDSSPPYVWGRVQIEARHQLFGEMAYDKVWNIG